MTCSLRAILFGFLMVALPLTANAGHKPLWEAYIGLTGLQVPHYRGSDSAHNYLIPTPIFIYRGEHFKVNESGVKGLLFTSDKVKLDISLAMSLPASSDSEDARAGMPKLEPTLEVGPSLITQLWLADNKQSDISLHLPLRMAFSFDDLDVEDQGLILSPYLRWRQKRNQWTTGVSLGVSYADAHYHNYYYEVDPTYATPTRPAYQSSGGYSGTRLTLSVSKHFKKSWIAAFARYETLDSTVFEDSPLVERDEYLLFGLVYTHLIAKSKRKSTHSEYILDAEIDE